MTEITLVRHGQAQSDAKDEKSYDQLSPLGYEQSRWLGQHLADAAPRFDRVISGTLRRQVQTAQGLNLPFAEHHVQDVRLNELDYFGLAHSLQNLQGIALPDSLEGFSSHVPLVLANWQAGRIPNPFETFDAFQARIQSLLSDLAAHHKNVLLVTSSGVISMVMCLALGLEVEAMSKVFLSVQHTSLHRVIWRDNHLHLSQFNGTPHLDSPDRLYAKTYI